MPHTRPHNQRLASTHRRSPGARLVRSGEQEGTTMTTLGDAGAGPEPDHEARRHDDERGALFSIRTLLIITVAGVVGVLAGVSAGVATGIQATASAGLVAGIALGLVAGLVAAVVAGGAVAATLHELVGPPG